MKAKILCLALAATLGVTALAGCGKTESSSTSSGSSSAGSSTSDSTAAGSLPALKDNTLKLIIAAPEFNAPATGTPIQKEWQTKMEAYLGVKLDITWQYTPWASYRENEGVLLASGQYPDIMATASKDYPNQYGMDGMILNINDYKDYMTYYQKFVEGTPGGESAVYNPDGSMYSFQDGYVNVNNIEGSQSFTAYAYRFDLLKKNNLQPATTLDEYAALAKKLKELYPDAYPISNTTKDFAFYRGFVGAFHTWDVLYWNGTEWKFGPSEDNFRKMLVYLNGLYKDGLIDPEFVTDDADRAKEKALTGKVLTFPTLWAGNVNAWNKAKTDAEMEWGLSYLPEGEFGTAWKWGSKLPGYTLSKNFGVMISAKTEYPEYCVKMVDYQYSDEMIDMMNWGFEGDTYTVNSDGTKSFTDKITKAADPALALSEIGSTSMAYARCGIVFAPQVFEPLNMLTAQEPWWDKTDGYTVNQYWKASNQYGGKDSISPQDRAPFFSLDADESQMRATVATAYETIAKEYGAKFIIGEMDPSNDKDWSTYLSVLEGAGDMNTVIEMLNEKSK